MRFGVLIPHFGPHSDRDRAFRMGPFLEHLGFTSAWVRDHLGFSGGVAFESRSSHFVDPLITMAAIAATSDLTLGTAALTPIRQPVILAQMVGSLAYLARGRLILGVGLGKQHAFELAGYSGLEREERFVEMIDVLRVASRRDASYHGRWTHFDDLSLDPAPPDNLEVWYCGASLAALQRAVDHTDGWLPGRCPFVVFDRLLARLRALAGERGTSMRVGIVPLVSIDRDRETALANVNVDGLLKGFRAKEAWRRDGPFSTAEELRGALIAGSVDDVLQDLKALEERGVDEIVLDLRERMDAFEETLQRISEDILPAFASP